MFEVLLFFILLHLTYFLLEFSSILKERPKISPLYVGKNRVKTSSLKNLDEERKFEEMGQGQGQGIQNPNIKSLKKTCTSK